MILIHQQWEISLSASETAGLPAIMKMISLNHVVMTEWLCPLENDARQTLLHVSQAVWGGGSTQPLDSSKYPPLGSPSTGEFSNILETELCDRQEAKLPLTQSPIALYHERI